jgi:hypothetical protein
MYLYVCVFSIDFLVYKIKKTVDKIPEIKLIITMIIYKKKCR